MESMHDESLSHGYYNASHDPTANPGPNAGRTGAPPADPGAGRDGTIAYAAAPLRRFWRCSLFRSPRKRGEGFQPRSVCPPLQFIARSEDLLLLRVVIHS